VVIALEGLGDRRERLGRLCPEQDQSLLVVGQHVTEHVAAAGGEHVNLLCDVDFESVEPGLRLLYLRLDAAELFELAVGVRVQLGGHVLHPEQSSSILGASVLHLTHLIRKKLSSNSLKVMSYLGCFFFY